MESKDSVIVLDEDSKLSTASQASRRTSQSGSSAGRDVEADEDREAVQQVRPHPHWTRREKRTQILL